MVDVLDALDAQTELMHRETLLLTEQGREVPLVVLADPPVTTPEQAFQSNSLVVYIQANIHGGEVEQEEDFSGYPAAVVADSCKIIIDRRFLIEESINNVKKDIKGLLDNLETSREGFKYKISDLHEVIPTMADKNSHLVSELSNSIKEIILNSSDYPILAEESGKSKDDLGKIFWVIDPLDGTGNYNRGIPICLSLIHI